MRSKIAQKIFDETPQEVKDKVREYGNKTVETNMKDEYPITSYTTVFKIWRFRLTRIKKYRFIVTHGVRPKDYPEKVGSVRYEVKWL